MLLVVRSIICGALLFAFAAWAICCLIQDFIDYPNEYDDFPD